MSVVPILIDSDEPDEQPLEADAYEQLVQLCPVVSTNCPQPDPADVVE
jgi:hypothetical protein